MQHLAGALGGELGARIQMNVYLTPPGSRGFKPHYDTHDVFIAQVHGSKVWRLAGAPYELPLADRRYDKSQPEPDPLQEFELCAGDMLYLPRGTIHSGSTNETASLHVTIGIHPVLWAEAILDAVQHVFGTDVRFRRALPPGYLHGENGREQIEAAFADLIEALREQLSPAAMAAETNMRINSISPPGLRHHLLDLTELPGIGPDTALRRRPGLRWQLSVDDSAARLSFHNKAVHFPAEVADEVRYMAEQTAPVTAASIPGDLDQPGRATLIHVLLSEGFLTLR
jgi:hypothetical protein